MNGVAGKLLTYENLYLGIIQIKAYTCNSLVSCWYNKLYPYISIMQHLANSLKTDTFSNIYCVFYTNNTLIENCQMVFQV